jgi:hypothetical protein
MSSHNSLLVFCGHHKCGTTWVNNIVNKLCKDLGLHFKHYHSPKLFSGNLAQEVSNLKLDFVSLTNADISYLNQVNSDYKAFHIIRDPRDIVVSAYFSHLYSHSDFMWPELNSYRNELSSVSKDKGLFLTINQLENFTIDGDSINLFEGIRSWDYSRDNIYEVKFEDIICNSYGIYLDVFRHLGILKERNSYLNKQSLLKAINEKKHREIFQSLVEAIDYKFGKGLTPEHLLSIIYRFDFSRVTKGRKPGEENVKSHFRKGVPGDWKNHFNGGHKKFFKDQYGELLISLGYESNYDW